MKNLRVFLLKKYIVIFILTIALLFGIFSLRTVKAQSDCLEVFGNAEIGKDNLLKPIISGGVENALTDFAYNGIAVSGGENGGVIYNQDINISDNTIDDTLIELLITPQSIGSGTSNDLSTNPNLYTPDFERLTITLTQKDNPDNMLTIEFHSRNDGNNKTIMITAAGTGQLLAGEMSKINAAKNIDCRYLTYDYSGRTPYSFDGCSREVMRDENDAAIPLGSNGSIKLFYDKNTNTLYTNYGVKSTNEGSTMVSSNGKYKWRIRKFGQEYEFGYPNETVGQDLTWNGFTSDEIEMKIQFNDVKPQKRANILLLNVDGEDLSKKIIAKDIEYYGISGYEYSIPAPIIYDQVGRKVMQDLPSGINVSINKGQTVVMEETPYFQGLKFTPDSNGEYTINYSYLGENSSAVLSVFTDQEKPLNIIPTLAKLPDYIIYNNEINLGAVAESQIYLNGEKPTMSLKISKGGTTITENNALEAEYNYSFIQSGEYLLTYSALDIVGRQKTYTLTVKVHRNIMSFKDDIPDNYLWFYGEQKPPISKEDVEVYDLESGLISSDNISIYISVTDDDYTPYTDNYTFNELGVYYIKYVCTYNIEAEEIISEIKRTITLFDTTSPIVNVSGIPQNTAIDTSKTDTDSLKHLKAKKGAEITLSELVISAYDLVAETNIDLSANVKIMFIDNLNNITEITESVNDNSYSHIFNNIGLYSYRFEVTDESDFKSSFVYRIDVREYWLEVDTQNIPEEIESGNPININSLKVKDFDGNIVSDANLEIKVYYNGEEEDVSEDFIPEKAGVYNIAISAQKNNEQLLINRAVTVIDTTPPVIVLKEDIPSTFSVNREIVLPEAEVTDNNDLFLNYTITVKIDEESVNVLFNKFTAEKAGEYLVTYTATDSNGNIATKQYTIEIKAGCGQCSSGISFGGVIMIVLLLIVFNFNYFKQKRIRGK